MKPSRMEKRIQSASMLIALGLFVLAGSLTEVHPRAFMVFLVVGCPLVIAGILLYLLSLPQE